VRTGYEECFPDHPKQPKIVGTKKTSQVVAL
jgi:hypothetical protein